MESRTCECTNSDEVRFDAVRLEDDVTEGGWSGSSPGADIDAVELLELDAP